MESRRISVLVRKCLSRLKFSVPKGIEGVEGTESFPKQRWGGCLDHAQTLPAKS
jgi:hypothetical protein